MITPPSPDCTIAEARSWLRELVDDGAHCPVCTQFAKTYRRKIHATMARDLIHVYRKVGTDWFHVRVIGGHPGDFAKLVYWRLIEPDEGVREDGSTRTGWWRITHAGVAWLSGRTRLPKYARIYDGRCMNLYGDPQTIRDALGARFNYDELMRGE